MSLSILSLRRFLYISELVPTMPSTVVGQILRQSRERNHQLKLSGALLFDGERFCQLLEGAPDATQALMQRIERDPRHRNVQVLLDALSPATRMMPQWQCGYADHEVFDAICAAAARDPEQGAHTFLQLLPTCDLSG